MGLQTAVLVTEYGCGADADETLLTPTIESQDKAMISAIVWPWKNNCFQAGCQTSWSLYDSGSQNGTVANQNGPERPNRVRILSRVHPRGVIGQLQHYFYNTTTSSFIMTAKCLNQTSLLSVNETLVYIPRRLNSSVINVTGQAILKTIIQNPDQSRLVVINPTCTGQYQVLVANTTDQIRELHQAELTNKHLEAESNGRHGTKSSTQRAYALFQLLHATAVRTGQTFATMYAESGNKVMVFPISIFTLTICLHVCSFSVFDLVHRLGECCENQPQTADAAAEQVAAVKTDFSVIVLFRTEQINKLILNRLDRLQMFLTRNTFNLTAAEEA